MDHRTSFALFILEKLVELPVVLPLVGHISSRLVTRSGNFTDVLFIQLSYTL